MTLQADATTVTEGIVTITPETDEVYTINVSGELVGGSPPTLPVGVLYQQVDRGADIVLTLTDQPTVGSATTLLQRLRNFTPGDYRVRLTFLTSGNRRPVTILVRCVE